MELPNPSAAAHTEAAANKIVTPVGVGKTHPAVVNYAPPPPSLVAAAQHLARWPRNELAVCVNYALRSRS